MFLRGMRLVIADRHLSVVSIDSRHDLNAAAHVILLHKTSTMKTPGQSETLFTEIVCPNDTNPMGLLQGGRLVQWMDMACAVCAQTHAQKICVTLCIADMKFRASAKVGEVVTIRAKMTRAFHTSMEIQCKAWSRDIATNKQTLINEAFFTFVAIDETGKPATVEPLHPESDIEVDEYVMALARKPATHSAAH
jgi:acyl-CoA hydrolase